MIRFPKEKLFSSKDINADGEGQTHPAFINGDSVEDLIRVRRGEDGKESYQIYLGIGEDLYVPLYNEEILKKAEKEPIEANTHLLWHPRHAFISKDSLFESLPMRAAGMLKKNPIEGIRDERTRKLVEELRSLKNQIEAIHCFSEFNDPPSFEKEAKKFPLLEKRLREVLSELCAVDENRSHSEKIEAEQEGVKSCREQAENEDPLGHRFVEKYASFEAGADIVYFHPTDIDLFPVRRDQVLANLDGLISSEALQVPEYLKQKRVMEVFRTGKLGSLDLENLSNEELLEGLRAAREGSEDIVVQTFSLLKNRRLSPEELLSFASLVGAYKTSPSEKISEAASLAGSAIVSNVDPLVLLVSYYLEILLDSSKEKEALEALHVLLPLVHRMLADQPSLPIHRIQGMELFLENARNVLKKVGPNPPKNFETVVSQLVQIVKAIQKYAQENVLAIVQELKSIHISMKLSRGEESKKKTIEVLDQEARRCLIILRELKDPPVEISIAFIDLFLDFQGIKIPPDLGSTSVGRVVNLNPAFSKENLELALSVMQRGLPELVKVFQQELSKPKRELVWEGRLHFLIPIFAHHLKHATEEFSLFTPEQVLWLAEQDSRLKGPALSALKVLFANLPPEQRQPEVNQRLEKIFREVQFSQREEDHLDAAIAAPTLLGEASVPLLAKLAKDRSKEVRRFATQSLGFFAGKSDEARKTLEAALWDSDVAVETHAARALLRADHPAVADHLWQRLNQYFARNLLPESYQNDPMRTRLKYELPDGREGETSLFDLSLVALEKFPPPDGAKDLIISLMRREKREEDRLLLFQALSHVVSTPRAIEISLNLLEEPNVPEPSPFYLSSILKAYQNCDKKEQSDSLTQKFFQLLAHPDPQVRGETFSMLFNVAGDERTKAAILEMSKAKKAEVRKTSIEYLSSPLMDEEGKKRLEEMREDSDEGVSNAARKRLEELASSDW